MAQLQPAQEIPVLLNFINGTSTYQGRFILPVLCFLWSLSQYLLLVIVKISYKAEGSLVWSSLVLFLLTVNRVWFRYCCTFRCIDRDELPCKAIVNFRGPKTNLAFQLCPKLQSRAVLVPEPSVWGNVLGTALSFPKAFPSLVFVEAAKKSMIISYGYLHICLDCHFTYVALFQGFSIFFFFFNKSQILLKNHLFYFFVWSTLTKWAEVEKDKGSCLRPMHNVVTT